EGRQGRAPVYARAERVERELADGDAHAADAEVSEAEDTLAVGDDDDGGRCGRRVGEYSVELVALGVRDVETARPPEEAAVALAARADGRRVDDRHHLRGVLLQQAVEERLVALLQ